MFNLLVKAQAWADGRDTMLGSRVFEYTEQPLVDRFKPAGQLDFVALAALPTLFVIPLPGSTSCCRGTGADRL